MLNKLETLLENEYSFRDYEILPPQEFRTNSMQGIHVLVDSYDSSDIERQIEDSLYTFNRDGYSTIFFYYSEILNKFSDSIHAINKKA